MVSTGSGRQQVALPEVEIDGGVRLGRLAPQLARVEAHAVDVLRLLATMVRRRIR